MNSRPWAARFILAALAFASISCQSESLVTPGSDILGHVEVTAATTGPAPDPDGYTLTVEGRNPQIIGSNATVTLDVATGTRTIELTGIAPNCQIQGENPRKLAVSAGAPQEVAFAVECIRLPDSKILFQSSRDDGKRGLNTMERDGSQVRNLASGALHYFASWSPDGSRLAFTSDQGGGKHLFIMNADGSGGKTLTSTDLLSTPAWSPDGRTIAFLMEDPNRGIGGQIFLSRPEGGAPVQLTHGPAFLGSTRLEWSPDGSRLLFAGASPAGIFVAGRDGTETALTAPGWRQQDSDAQWSPDGSKISFLRHDENPDWDMSVTNLWIMDADGSNQTKLTDFQMESAEGGSVWGYTWSPDGTSIIASLNGELYRMSPDGGVKTYLVGGTHPVWSPEGSRILFQSFGVDNAGDLFTMNPDGSGVQNLTTSSTTEWDAAWQP